MVAPERRSPEYLQAFVESEIKKNADPDQGDGRRDRLSRRRRAASRPAALNPLLTKYSYSYIRNYPRSVTGVFRRRS